MLSRTALRFQSRFCGGNENHLILTDAVSNSDDEALAFFNGFDCAEAIRGA